MISKNSFQFLKDLSGLGGFSCLKEFHWSKPTKITRAADKPAAIL